jgi:transcriptional regulator with XRE-family HTH domain
MALWDEIKELRVKAGLRQKDVAAKIGCSAMRISQIEKPPDHGGYLPSHSLIRKIAAFFASSEEDRKKLELKLLYERTKLGSPDEVVEHFFPNKIKEAFILSATGMPDVFIKRVQEDMDKTMLKKSVKEKTGLDEKTMDAFLNGRHVLSREAVIAMAIAMNQSPEEYLLLADYIPENLKYLVKNRDLSNIFRSLADMPHEDMSDIINVINTTIDIIKKRRKK